MKRLAIFCFVIVGYFLPVYADDLRDYREQIDKVLMLQVATEVRYEEEGVTYSKLEWTLLTGWAFEDEEGKWIITAGHLVRFDVSRIKGIFCLFQSGQEAPQELTLVGYDQRIDTALLKCVDVQANKNLPVLLLGDSAGLRAGQAVFSVGHPRPLDWAVTTGFVNDPHFMPIPTGVNLQAMNFIVHDSRLETGSSGSPLFDNSGKVVGINVELHRQFAAAIPINDIKLLMPNLKKGGEVRHPPVNIIFDYSGRFTDARLQLRGVSRRPDQEGIMVASVRPNSLAEYLGFRAGDMVLAINDEAPKDLMDLYKKIYFKTLPVEIFKIRIRRDGAELELPLILLLDSFKRE